ncbi:unnamed protein product [Thlaspi arvense]|uniref:Uncharacterized protein n=1 Tax=Thlaspi arvense TaxID=13288 RepID=A0AAU9RUW5_THLAR|nr:unnamed protein product [Thlaspi arvense]
MEEGISGGFLLIRIVWQAENQLSVLSFGDGSGGASWGWSKDVLTFAISWTNVMVGKWHKWILSLVYKV